MIQPTSAAESITSSYGYDAAGNVTRFGDGNGNTTSYSYNSWELREETVEPATAAYPGVADRTYTTVYDAGGLAVEERLPGAVTVERTFDELGRVVVEAGSGGDGAASRSFFL